METCPISLKRVSSFHSFASAPSQENAYSLNRSQTFFTISERMGEIFTKVNCYLRENEEGQSEILFSDEHAETVWPWEPWAYQMVWTLFH